MIAGRKALVKEALIKRSVDKTFSSKYWNGDLRRDHETISGFRYLGLERTRF